MRWGISLWKIVANSSVHCCTTSLSLAVTAPRQCGTAAPSLCICKNSDSSLGKAAAEVYLHPTEPAVISGIGKNLHPFCLKSWPNPSDWGELEDGELWCWGVQSRPKHILTPLRHTPSLTRECLWIPVFNLSEKAACDAGLLEQIFKGISKGLLQARWYSWTCYATGQQIIHSVQSRGLVVFSWTLCA